MTMSIFNDIWNSIVNLFTKFQELITKYQTEPLFWLIIFAVLLVIAYLAISSLANK